MITDVTNNNRALFFLCLDEYLASGEWNRRFQYGENVFGRNFEFGVTLDEGVRVSGACVVDATWLAEPTYVPIAGLRSWILDVFRARPRPHYHELPAEVPVVEVAVPVTVAANDAVACTPENADAQLSLF